MGVCVVFGVWIEANDDLISGGIAVHSLIISSDSIDGFVSVFVDFLCVVYCVSVSVVC